MACAPNKRKITRPNSKLQTSESNDGPSITLLNTLYPKYDTRNHRAQLKPRSMPAPQTIANIALTKMLAHKRGCCDFKSVSDASTPGDLGSMLVSNEITPNAMNSQLMTVTDRGRGEAEIAVLQKGHTLLTNHRLFAQVGHFIMTLADAGRRPKGKLCRR